MSSPVVQDVRHDDPALLPPRALADGTLRRLQEAALVLFSERGYHGVSMRELAAEAGIRASSIYAHVASKEELLRQLLLIAHDEHRDGMRRAVLDAEGNPAEQLAAATRAHVRMHATYPMLALVANNELRSLTPDAQRSVHAVRGDAEGMLHDIIERGVRLGAFTCTDTWLAMAAIGALGIRVASWYRANESPYRVEDVCDQYAQFALRIAGAV